MAVKYRIVWSEKANADLARIYDSILAKWSLREAERLLVFVKEFENTVANYPNTFKKSKVFPNVRLGFVHRNTRAVYAVRPDYIIILALFDNRENNPFV